MNSEEHAEMIQEFNTNSNKTIILVTLYALNFSNLNLQSLCWNVHLFVTSMSEAVAMQAIDCY